MRLCALTTTSSANLKTSSQHVLTAKTRACAYLGIRSVTTSTCVVANLCRGNVVCYFVLLSYSLHINRELAVMCHFAIMMWYFYASSTELCSICLFFEQLFPSVCLWWCYLTCHSQREIIGATQSSWVSQCQFWRAVHLCFLTGEQINVYGMTTSWIAIYNFLWYCA